MADTGRQTDQKGTARKRLKDIDTEVLKEVQGELVRLIEQEPPIYTRILQYINVFLLSIIIPLLVVAITQLEGEFSPDLDETARILIFSFPLSFALLGFMPILYVFEFTSNRNTLKEAEDILVERGESRVDIEISTTPTYKLINRLQLGYILGTFFIACLWYTFPHINRIEPLAAIYAFGTAVFAYFRLPFGVPSNLDTFA